MTRQAATYLNRAKGPDFMRTRTDHTKNGGKEQQPVVLGESKHRAGQHHQERADHQYPPPSDLVRQNRQRIAYSSIT